MKEIVLNGNEHVAFENHASACIGTGRLGLALQQEYMDELRAVQKLCDFKYIRGHGLFCDDIGIYQKTAEGETRYCFTYLDRIIDNWLSAGVKPFLELGFMPYALASGTQTLFYWKCNVTPPADEEEWVKLVRVTLRHLKERYGEEEVALWPVEIWNEPNLTTFWEGADLEKYLRLYEITSAAVRAELPKNKIGGPAVCGGNGIHDWERAFLSFCREKKLPLDFLTRHLYMAQTPEHRGEYMYHKMCTPAQSLSELKESREVIDSFPEYRGMPMVVTEFNTSYNPRCPIHDTVLNASIIAGMLSVLGDEAEAYSYWTFGDVFEESGIPYRPFHGGFGLMAAGNIPKPTLWTFHFFREMAGECVYRDDQTLILRGKDGAYDCLLWNTEKGKTEVCLSLPAEGEMTAVTQRVDDQHGNPLKVWHDLGEPATLSKTQEELLRRAAVPQVETEVLNAQEGRVELRAQMDGPAVLFVQLRPRREENEPGYDYEWYRQ